MKHEIVYQEPRMAIVDASSPEEANDRFVRFRREGATLGILSDLPLGDDVVGEICQGDDDEGQSVHYPERGRLDRTIRLDPADTRPFFEKCRNLERRYSKSLRVRIRTSDERIDYTFDAGLYVDHLRLETILAIDPERLAETLNVIEMLQVVAASDETLERIIFAYNEINRRLALLKDALAVGASPRIALSAAISQHELYDYIDARRKSEENAA